MFTGLIEATGTLGEVTGAADGLHARIETPLAGELREGDSVAVNGVCLTAVRLEPGAWHADIGPETARVTTLGGLRPGQVVNLERPLTPSARLGGHFVLGHVDGLGTVEEIRPEAGSTWIGIAFPAPLAPYFIPKGSVAVDGISLTVATLDHRRFDVQIIPFTWSHTSLRTLRVGDRVNLECDMLGKYVLRAADLAARGHGPRG
jgi:riboflavin synthase